MKILNRLLKTFIFSNREKQVIKKIALRKNYFKKRSDSYVMVDIPDSANELAEQFAFSKYFQKKYSLKIVGYYPSFHLLVNDGLLGKIKNKLLYHSRGQKISRFYGINEFLNHQVLNKIEIMTALDDAKYYWKKIKTKQDLIDLEIENVKLGISVYDSYLRVYSKPTVDLEDDKLFYLFQSAFLTLYGVIKFFKKRNIKIVLLGHAVYIGWKIISDYAINNNIDVYVTYNSRFSPLHHVNGNNGLQTIDHANLKQKFDNLDSKDKNKAFSEAKKLMQNRWKGKIDNSINYMSKTAFSANLENDEINLLNRIDCEKKSIIFMLHSFFDSPHIYKNMIFEDFYEWCMQSFKYIENNKLHKKYNIIIKPHPNRIEGEDEIINKLLKKFPFLISFKGNESNHLILKVNPATIITVYGTVTAEFTIKKIPVVTAGDNPASSFNFSFEAKNKIKYFNYIKNADKLIVNDSQVLDAYAFIYTFLIGNTNFDFNTYPFGRFKRHLHLKGFVDRVNKFSFIKFEEIIRRYEKK